MQPECASRSYATRQRKTAGSSRHGGRNVRYAWWPRRSRSGQPGGPGGPGGPPPGPKEDPNERMFCADSLPQLADCLGFTGRKKENFLASIARYNEFCETGRDEDFGKDPRVLLPLCKPPYYAFRRHAQIGNEFLATVDGLWTDERQNVLGMDKEPIPRPVCHRQLLWQTLGRAVFHPIPGVSIGMAWTLGRLCGMHAAEDIPQEEA